jgi:hypothetical protein
MFISKEELNRRLNSSKNLATVLPQAAPKTAPCVQSDIPSVPNSITPDEVLPSVQTIPPSVRSLAVSLVMQGAKINDVARQFSVPVDIITKGLKNPDDKVVDSMQRVRELALDRLLIALGLMTPDKFESAPFKELTNSVGHLARVLDKTAPSITNDNRVQYLVYAPPARSLDQYDVKEV